GRVLVTLGSVVVTTGSVVVTPGSVVVTPGSVVVPPGSVVVTTGSVVVTPGSVVVTSGSVVVPPGSVVVTTGSVVVTTGSVVVTTGSVVVTHGSVVVTPGSVVVTTGSVVVTTGSVVVTTGSILVMDAPTIPVSADSSEGNFGDAIDIGVDVFHPVPVDVVAFLVVTIVTTLARHGEAIRGIHEHLQGVSIEEDMSTLRFRMGMAEAENASLRGKIRTMEAIETVTRSQERRDHIKMERQLSSVQESQRQD
ncbi:hypothetical protein Tco_1071997, partial [Tanacetum coccineum]